jgi:hypothetical protein
LFVGCEHHHRIVYSSTFGKRASAASYATSSDA